MNKIKSEEQNWHKVLHACILSPEKATRRWLPGMVYSVTVQRVPVRAPPSHAGNHDPGAPQHQHVQQPVHHAEPSARASTPEQGSPLHHVQTW